MSASRVYENINFVPEWYVSQCRRRMQNHRMTMLLLLLIGGLSVMQVFTWKRVSTLSYHRDALSEQVVEVNGKLTEVQKLQAARATLGEQVRLYNKYARPVTFSRIASTLAAMTPDSVFLAELTSDTHSKSRTRVVTPADQSATGQAITKTEHYQVVRVAVSGTAPTNVEIANYVGRLSETRLFRNVKMVYSREGHVGDSVTREFRITMEVPLDRDYRVVELQEVADAH